jgi:hypothetical protein
MLEGTRVEHLPVYAGEGHIQLDTVADRDPALLRAKMTVLVFDLLRERVIEELLPKLDVEVLHGLPAAVVCLRSFGLLEAVYLLVCIVLADERKQLP